jgi:hypothetical protein
VSASQTFRTSPGSYAVLCGVLSAPLVFTVWRVISGGLLDGASLLISIILPATAAIWLSHYRLRIDDSGIEYRDLFGKNFRVAFSEITSLKARSISYGRGSGITWVLNLRDGRRLRMNLKPFPREVYGLLSQKIRISS